MGHPRKQKKKYEKPRKPYDKVRIEKEKKIRKDFGLRRKKEIWKAENTVRDFRRRARELQAFRDEAKEKLLINKLSKLGINCSKIDDILDLETEDILSRRLQTIVFRRGLCDTAKQARQMIVHGHVLVDGSRIRKPSFIVEPSNKIELSGKIKTAAKGAKVV